MPGGSFTLDAEIVARFFTLDAWIVDDRWRHDRQLAHSGVESDLYVVLAEDTGPYVAFTPIHYVLEDILERLTWLETATRTRGSFTLDAWISDKVFTLDAIIKATMSGSFTLDAWIGTRNTFTLDAWISAAVHTFTLDAYIV